MTSPGVMREAHPMISKSIQSIVGIFVGFAIGGLLGLVATPIAPATSMPRSGFIAHVDREAQPVAVEVTAVLRLTTTRVSKDDAVLPLTPAPPEAQTADPAPKPKPKSSKAASTQPTTSRPTQKAAPKPKPQPKPAARPPSPPPTANPPDPVVQEPAPTPEPKAGKPAKPPKQGKPPKPPKPPK